MFYYLDDANHEQGPFSGRQMLTWYKAGHILSTRLVRSGSDSEYMELGTYISKLQKELEERSSNSSLPSEEWRKVFDTETKLYYYWNSRLNIAQWETPSNSNSNQTNRENQMKEKEPQQPKMHRARPVSCFTRPSRPVIERSATSHTTILPKKKRQALQEVLDMNQQLRVVPKSQIVRNIIEGTLKKQAMFADLSRAELNAVCDAFDMEEVSEGSIIESQGKEGEFFYVLQSGMLEVIVNRVKVCSLSGNDCFGELSLLCLSPAVATIRATSQSVLWKISRDIYRTTLALAAKHLFEERREALKQVKLLETLSKGQLSRLCGALHEEVYEEGDVIVRKGDTGTQFFMLSSGTVKCTEIQAGTRKLDDVHLPEGSYFGERALIRNEPRAANVIATSAVRCLVLKKSEFEPLLGQLSDILAQNLGARCLRAMPQLSHLSNNDIANLVEAFEKKSVETRTMLFRKSEPANHVYVIGDGSVRLTTQDGTKKIMKAGDYFGEEALSSNSNGLYQCTAVAEGTVELFILPKTALESDILNTKHVSSNDNDVPNKNSNEKFKLEDLQEVSVLGSGTFGVVKLVRHNESNKMYALKIMMKSRIVEFKQKENVLREKEMMFSLKHPFILNIHATLQDEHHLYMVLDLVQGGELYSILLRKEVLSLEESRFYTACVVSVIGYLQKNGISYRDLKPENIMLDKDGYIKLIDFGFAKKIEDRTWTLCGTPEYLAPEIVNGKGYDSSVDWWAVGVLLFEMMAGYSPFSDPTENQMIVFKNILNAPIEFPEQISDPDAQDIIRSLLCRDSSKRIGCLSKGDQDVKNHKFFSSLNWDELLDKQIPAPWIPALKTETDLQYFEDDIEDHEFTPYVDDGTGWDKEF
eukprot:TRINITY_DN1650_c0_g1_i1.p1 TRINITY_DN1650_c0_g1~~TRINITY_DN1650_c0_g1_i1.p1  ORF type:complete len:869 (+),score=216.79 TRINITY_DN1650_c0_g1_i1:141-2747(+)